MTVAMRGKDRAELRTKLAKLYQAGHSVRSLVPLAQGRSYGFVYQLLREAHVTFRPHSQRRTSKRTTH